MGSACFWRTASAATQRQPASNDGEECGKTSHLASSSTRRALGHATRRANMRTSNEVPGTPEHETAENEADGKGQAVIGEVEVEVGEWPECDEQDNGAGESDENSSKDSNECEDRVHGVYSFRMWFVSNRCVGCDGGQIIRACFRFERSAD